MNSKTILALLFVPLIGFAAEPPGKKKSMEPAYVDSRATVVKEQVYDNFLALENGEILAVEGNEIFSSTDEGKTWKKYSEIYNGKPPGTVGSEQVWTRAKDGSIILIYSDAVATALTWNQEQNKPAKNPEQDIWCIRSTDNGKTWQDRQKLLDGYCKKLTDIFVSSKGTIVVPVERFLENPYRHQTATFVSKDNGKTWKESPVVEIGGNGNHDGGLEGTIAELKDGRLYMLLRTSWDRFWQAYSEDEGLTWKDVGPGGIASTSAPGFLENLSDGRWMLIWNPLPEGKQPRDPNKLEPWPDAVERQTAEKRSEWFWLRKDLAIAFSADNGKTWSKPTLLISREGKNGGTRYPKIFERRPGEFWVSLKGIRLVFKTADFK